MICPICDKEMYQDAVRFGPEFSHPRCLDILFWYAISYAEYKKPTLEPTA